MLTSLLLLAAAAEPVSILGLKSDFSTAVPCRLKSDDSTRPFVRRVRAHADFSGKASRLLAAGQALDVRAFGAKGDGIADDAPAIQKAIDAAQLSRQKLALPAGTYLVKSMLRVHYNGGPQSAEWTNCTFNSTDSVMIPGWCPSALHLVGDGGWGLETTIKAGALMEAVIDVGFGPKGPSVPRAGPSLGHEFHDFVVAAGLKAYHGIRAYAIIRSVVSGLTVMDAAHVGVEMGYGFINRIEDCNFQGSAIALKSANQANAVVIANNNMEGQFFAGIVVGNSVGGMIIEGNEIEGCGGPPIIIFGMTTQITIKSNYFATTNVGHVFHTGPNRQTDPTLGQYRTTYGPLEMKPDCGINPTGENGDDCFGSPKNITIVADIVLGGCLASLGCLTIPPTVDPFTCVLSYCSKLPTVGAKISGNYHGMSSPFEAKVNATNTTDVAWGAVFANAVIGLEVTDNLDHGGGGNLPPLVVGGSNRQLFVAKDVRISGNLGFQASPSGYYQVENAAVPGGRTIADPSPGSGWLRLLGSDVGPCGGADTESPPIPGETNPAVMRGCMDYHTWVSAGVRVRNFLAADTWASVSAKPMRTNASEPAPLLTKTKDSVDGDTVWEWSQHQHSATSLLLGELDLSANPSVANHTVFLAVDTRLLFNATLVLLMDAGDGVWRSSGSGVEHMLISNVPKTNAVYMCGDAQLGSRLWAVSSFQLQMQSTGTARFGLRLSDVKGADMSSDPAVLQLRKVGAAVVGTGWDRMFAAPTLQETGLSCGREHPERDGEEAESDMHAELALLKRELSDLKSELRSKDPKSGGQQ